MPATHQLTWPGALTGLLLATAAGNLAAQQPAPVRMTIGTGFVAGKGGITTNAHVVDGCRSVELKQSDAPPVHASQIRIDRALDLAVVDIALPRPAPALPLRHDPPRLGEPAYLLGFPLQRSLLPGQPSFYATTVSGLGGLRGDPQVFRLQALALPGMSGAPVLDASGRVIGVVKTHLIETAPNHGPTLGGESFAVIGPAVAKFVLDAPASGQSENGASLSSTEIAARAVSSTVMITCQKDEAK